MIEVTQTTLFMLYLGFTLGPLLALWVFQHYAGRHKKIDLTDRRLYVCEYCQFCYLERHAQKITRCPQCRSLNKGKPG